MSRVSLIVKVCKHRRRRCTIVRGPDGWDITTCCKASTSCDEHGTEYCKCCYRAVENPGAHFEVKV